MFFNHDVFGTDYFKVSDSTLFERTGSKATKYVEVHEVDNFQTNRFIIWNTVRCFRTGDDGDKGQVVRVEPGGTNDYSTAGFDCYAQTVYVFVDDESGGGGIGAGSGDPGQGGGGSNLGYDPNLYWWNNTPCPEATQNQQLSDGDCHNVIGWMPLNPIFETTVLANGFTNPCIVAAKNKLPDFDLNILGKNLFRWTGFQPPAWKIVYSEDRTITDRHPTNPTLVPAASEPDADPTVRTWYIKLNPTFWEQGTTNTVPTQEIAGLNIIHEYMHGFIYVYKGLFGITKLNNLTTHEAMFKNCIEAMKQQLMKSFSLSTEDATALALQGMDNLFYKNADDPNTMRQEVNQYAITNYGMSIPQANDRSDQFLNGIKGTKCF